MLRCAFPLAVLLWFVAGQAVAACGGEIHINSGSFHTTIYGKVPAQSFCEYRFYGQKGQGLQISLGKYDRAIARLHSPIEKKLPNDQLYILPKSGKYSLRLYLPVTARANFPHGQNFTLQFAIHPRPKETTTIAGRYQAIVPCERCTGIETHLTLHEDGHYALNEKFLGLGANIHAAQQGKWIQKGQAINLRPNDPSKDDRYLVYKHGALYWIAPFEAHNPHPSLRRDYRLQRQL